jgi:predicted neutral ceramidase superfamily lipid hydrolase
MLTALSTLLKAFFDICLLRKGPQDLPKSSLLLSLCLILYTVLDVLLTVQTRPFTDALLVSLVDVGFLLVVTFLILSQHKHLDRMLQTMSALFGTGLILGIFIFPLVYGGVQNQYESWLQQIIVLLFLIMVIWNVVVLAHIVRHAISTSMGIGIMIAILYIWMSSLLITMLFPEISA